jgi:WXXGXW repeat (2 copies)
MRKALRLAIAPIALVSAMLLIACVEAPPPGAVFVRVPPPAYQTEVIGVAPGPGYFWIGGHHAWNGSAYAWTAGRWEAAPRRGVTWRAGRWVHHSKGWYWREGRWK